MTHVFCDRSVPEAAVREAAARTGIPCLRLDLTGENPLRYDPQKLCETLISLV